MSQLAGGPKSEEWHFRDPCAAGQLSKLAKDDAQADFKAPGELLTISMSPRGVRGQNINGGLIRFPVRHVKLSLATSEGIRR